MLGLLIEGAVIHNAMAFSLSRTVGLNSRRAVNSLDARMTAQAAENLLARGPTQAPAALALARKALSRDATVVRAARTAGLAIAMGGDAAGGARAMHYAMGLSRRDMPTLLWNIESRVEKGDIHGALRGYDIALRAVRSSGTVLMPILVRASSDPSISPALVTYIAENRPPWTQSYLDTTLSTAKDWRTIAVIVQGLATRGVPIEQSVADQAIRTVADAGRTDIAYDIYLTRTPAARSQFVRNGNFSGVRGQSPFDWQIVRGEGRSAEIADGVLAADIGSDGDGIVARQMTLLAPGRYRLNASLEGTDIPTSAMPYWTIDCFRPIEVSSPRLLPISRPGGASWANMFVVDTKCPAQYLTLTAPHAGASVTYRVDNVTITPQR